MVLRRQLYWKDLGPSGATAVMSTRIRSEAVIEFDTVVVDGLIVYVGFEDFGGLLRPAEDAVPFASLVIPVFKVHRLEHGLALGLIVPIGSTR